MLYIIIYYGNVIKSNDRVTDIYKKKWCGKDVRKKKNLHSLLVGMLTGPPFLKLMVINQKEYFKLTVKLYDL